MNKYAGFILGLTAGAVIGFFWGNGAKSALSENTSTDINGGVITVKIDTLKAAMGSLNNLWG